MTKCRDCSNIFFLSQSPKLAPRRPHLDCRCVLLGLQSMLKFFPISNSIHTKRQPREAFFLACLAISEHPVIWVSLPTISTLCLVSAPKGTPLWTRQGAPTCLNFTWAALSAHSHISSPACSWSFQCLG